MFDDFYRETELKLTASTAMFLALILGSSGKAIGASLSNNLLTALGVVIGS